MSELKCKPITQQIWFTNVCFSIGSGYARKHRIQNDSFVLGSAYIRESFGYGFDEVNDQYGLFCFGGSWKIGFYAKTCDATQKLKSLINKFYTS